MALEEQNDDTEPLKSFLVCMSQRFSDPQSRSDFETLLTVVSGATSSPQHVHLAVETVNKESSPDRSVLASFKAIPQGKRFLSLCEAASAGRAHIQSACEAFQSVTKECEALALVIDGEKSGEAVRKFTSSHASYKTAFAQAQQHLEEEAVKSAIARAKNSLIVYVKKLSSHQCKRELVPWMETQEKTLAASRIMSKPPAVDVMTLRPVIEKAFGEDLAELHDLDAFLNASSSVANEIEALLRLTVDQPREKREAAVRLCQQYSQWLEGSKKLTCSFPFTFANVDNMKTAINGIVESNCTAVWTESISAPRSVLVELINLNGNFESVKEAAENNTDKEAQDRASEALKSIADAKLLVTGLSDSAERCNLEAAALFLHRSLLFRDKLAFQSYSAAIYELFLMFRDDFKVFKAEQTLTSGLSAQPNELQTFDCISVYMYCMYVINCYLISLY